MVQRSVLPTVWDVPQEFRHRLGDEVGRQRAMFSKGHLLLVLHKPPKPEDVVRVGRFFWRQPDGTWTSNELGSGTGALTRHLDEFAGGIEKFEEQDEEAKSAEDFFAVMYGLAPVHRAARNLHAALQEARKLCPDDRDLINFRDRAYRIERTAELLHNDAKNSLDFAIAKRAEEQARSSHQMAASAYRLNVLAAFFFPIATLSAIFGMNLRNGFESVDATSSPIPFLGVLLVGVLCGFVLKSFVTRNADGPAAGRDGTHGDRSSR